MARLNDFQTPYWSLGGYPGQWGYRCPPVEYTPFPGGGNLTVRCPRPRTGIGHTRGPAGYPMATMQLSERLGRTEVSGLIKWTGVPVLELLFPCFFVFIGITIAIGILNSSARFSPALAFPLLWMAIPALVLVSSVSSLSRGYQQIVVLLEQALRAPLWSPHDNAMGFLAP